MNETLRQVFYTLVGLQFLYVRLRLQHLVEKLPSSNIPDLWFGYSTKDLNNIFEFWGPDGRKAYASVATYDMIAFIPSYSIALGSLFHYFVRDWSLTLWWIPLIAWCDYIETFILMINCSAYPHADVHHMDTLVLISSYANMAKWVLLGGMFFVIVFTVIQNRKTENKDKKD